MTESDDVLAYRIRERAFQLWQNAGSPDGRDEEFWHLGREQVTQEVTPEPSDIVEDAAGHYPPTGDTQNFA